MRDISNIKPKYHIIFTSDWNKGDKSTLTYQERNSIAKLWLEFNHNDVFNPELNYIKIDNN